MIYSNENCYLKQTRCTCFHLHMTAVLIVYHQRTSFSGIFWMVRMSQYSLIQFYAIFPYLKSMYVIKGLHHAVTAACTLGFIQFSLQDHPGDQDYSTMMLSVP